MSKVDTGIYTNQAMYANKAFGYGGTRSKNEGKTGGAKAASSAARSASSKTGSLQLSEKAQAMLDKLKEKYGDKADIMVGDYDSDEEARGILSRGTKEFSVLLSEDELEKMADDEDYEKENYEKIDSAMNLGDKLKEQLSEDGDKKLTRFGISFNADGTTSFFAELEQVSESNKNFQESMKAQKEARKEEEAKNQERIEKRRENAAGKAYGKDKTPPKKLILTGDSEEDLIEQLKNVDWSKVQTPGRLEGGKLDFTI